MNYKELVEERDELLYQAAVSINGSLVKEYNREKAITYWEIRDENGKIVYSYSEED